jgi:hypothetical protein
MYPLPDADIILRDLIYAKLKDAGIKSHSFTITDPSSIFPWCLDVGIQPINAPSLACIWTYKTEPETCIELVREVVKDFLKRHDNDD